MRHHCGTARTIWLFQSRYGSISKWKKHFFTIHLLFTQCNTMENKGVNRKCIMGHRKCWLQSIFCQLRVVFFSHEWVPLVTLLLLSGLSNSRHLCGRITQLANLPLCLLRSILFLKERFKPDFVFDEILDVMEGAEAANTKMHLAILAPQGSSTVLKTRCPTMQLALGFWFPFGCWPVFQVSTQAHRQGTANCK